MRRTLRSLAGAALGLSLFLLPASSALAHGGGSGGAGVPMCSQDVHNYGLEVHFRAYLKHDEQLGFEQYCHHLPALGTAALVFDLVTPELHSTPVAITLERVRGSERETVASLPPKVYKDGGVTLPYDFMEPGKYVATVRIASDAAAEQQVALAFPFDVSGSGTGLGAPGVLAASAAAVALVGGGYALYRRRKPQG